MATRLPAHDPDDVEPYFVVWCDEDGTNTNTAGSDGELQGATISTSAFTMTGVTLDSENSAAVTIKGVSYGINTVSTAWISAGTAGADATGTCVITTSDSRTLSKSIIIPVRER